MSEHVELWAPPHLDSEDIATAMNHWMTQHPDRPPFQRALQDHASSKWPVMWHLKSKFIIQLDTANRFARPSVTTRNHLTENVCAICQNELKCGIEKLSCNHSFHTMCIHKWLRRSPTCPLCRADA